jgi:hypothetical protein
LQQLRHLDLHDALFGHPQLQLYSRLTASSQLAYLEVSYPDMQPLPQGAAQHMFPAGRVLTQLQTLELRGYAPDTRWCLDAGDLRSIISACPGLCRLDVCGVVQEGAAHVLVGLPACCSRLKVGGCAFHDASISVITQLRQLRDLEWRYSAGLTDAGFEQLTALTGLTRLRMTDMPGLSYEVADKRSYYDEVEFTLTTKAQVRGCS